MDFSGGSEFSLVSAGAEFVQETFEFILKTLNPKGILISQPAHTDSGKSSHLDNGRGKAEM